MFASRADLLSRCNARRLAQLAIPADKAIPMADEALRVAIDGGDLSGYSAADQSALMLGLDTIDKALADAHAFIVSYGIPETVQTTLLARLTSTVAWYYLQGDERMTDEVLKAYNGVVDTLKSHARGDLSLLPPDSATASLPEDMVQLDSSPRRYGSASSGDDW